jgi:extracellular elastinolytic metalloproteinase
VQNLFYLNNVAHDALYAAGFNEGAGNFQADNFGNGGLAGDPVNAEAQDGSGTDNANFATPSDGSSPRMQMYLWTSAAGDHQVITAAKPAGYAAAGAGFGPALTTTGFSGALANASVAEGCSAFTGVAGKIAIIDRGSCDFTVKVMNAQNAGATGAIIANHAGDGVFTMGGTNRKIKIPSVMVGQADGADLKLQANASATLRRNPVPPPQIDGDIDADIVFHEYGHGLSWRMVGSMSGPIAGAIGEGASDTLAFLLNGDDRIGEYSYSNALGIRRFAYTAYPYTYGDFCNDGCEVHNDGELYAAAMWRLFELYSAAGLSATDLLGDFVQGMNFTPAGPAFEDMRDGMLQAVGTDRDCLVWQAFAQYGVGVGADARTAKGGRSVTVTESFALPAECQ